MWREHRWSPIRRVGFEVKHNILPKENSNPSCKTLYELNKIYLQSRIQPIVCEFTTSVKYIHRVLENSYLCSSSKGLMQLKQSRNIMLC